MKLRDALFPFHKSRTGILAGNTILIVSIALLDWTVKENISLGFLYIFPMLVGGYLLSRRKILMLAMVCAILRENFAPWAWQEGVDARLFLTIMAYVGAGIFVQELVKAYQAAVEQALLRREAEEQLRILVESSPAAILNLNAKGEVLLANDAAHRLLGFDPGSLVGRPIRPFLPVLSSVPQAEGSSRFFRSMMECMGRKQDGETFLANIWFSTYKTLCGPRLAAIISDGSEELRDREGLGLDSSLATSRILVLAMLHEIRNLCAAASVAHTNLGRLAGLAGNEDFKALGSLVRGLEKLASSEMRLGSDRATASADLSNLFDELRILIEPSFRDSEIGLQWEVGQAAPHIQGDHHALLQVFLNLAQNSLRAMTDVERREMTISAALEDERLLVRFEDTGPGVPVPDRLFQPLQPGAEATGLGLYVSRAIVRSFNGDLWYEPRHTGSCFTVQLVPA